MPYGASDYTPYLVKAREQGCKALAINGVEPDAVAQVKAANAQGWNDLTFLFLTSVYSENFAAAIDDAAAGIYVPSRVLPVHRGERDQRGLAHADDRRTTSR